MTQELDIKHFKEKLLAEQSQLEEKLADIGRVNPDNPADWEATPGDINNDEADPNMLADSFEEYEARTATLKEMEDQLKDVREALVKIENGTYGVSEISGEPIEKDRLEAYPAARTTKAEAKNQ